MITREAHRYTLEGEYVDSFQSLTDVREKMGCNIASISLCLNKERNMAGGYMWSEDKVESMLPYNRKRITKDVSIHQYSLGGDYIREFNSYEDIQKSLGISYQQAHRVKYCCEYKHKFVSGYQWRYRKYKSILKLKR